MRDYYSVHSDSLADLMVSLGDVCPQMFWSEQTIRAMPSGAGRSSANSPGGFSLSADCTLVALVADFSDGVLPDSTQTLTYPVDGDEYKIVSRKIEPGGRIVKLTLESVAQGL